MKEEKKKPALFCGSRDKPSAPDTGPKKKENSDGLAADNESRGLQATAQNENVPSSARQYVLTGKQKKNWLMANMWDSSYVEIRDNRALVRKPTEKIRKKAVKLFVAVLALVCLLLSFPAGKLIAARFVIRNLVLESEGSITVSELAAAAGIGIDDSIFSASPGTCESRILESFPAIRSCNVKVGLGGDVTFTYSEYEAVVYFESAGRYYSADKDLYVIEVSDSPGVFAERGLIFVKLPQIKTALCGTVLEFFDSDGDYIREFLYATEGMPEKFATVSFENRFAVYSETDGGCTVNYGTVNDLETKLLFASRVLEYETVPENPVIDVSCQGKASIRGKKQTGS